MIEGHPQPLHDGEAAHVLQVGDGDDPWEPELPEPVIEPRGRRLGRGSLAPVLASEPPRDFDVVGVGRLMVETAHPEEHVVAGALDRE